MGVGQLRMTSDSRVCCTICCFCALDTPSLISQLPLEVLNLSLQLKDLDLFTLGQWLAGIICRLCTGHVCMQFVSSVQVRGESIRKQELFIYRTT